MTVRRAQALEERDRLGNRRYPRHGPVGHIRGRLAPSADRRHVAAHLDQPMSLAEMAAAGGVSVRTLSNAFRSIHGTSPMAWVKMLRLEKARADLISADHRERSVADIATRWGFFHLGKFAVDYRKAFYESPSETLRR